MPSAKRTNGYKAGIRLSAFESVESQPTASTPFQRSATWVALLLASGLVLSCIVLASTLLVSKSSPSAYPRWSVSNVRPPVSHISLNGSSLEWVMVNRTNATSSDSPTQVLQWFKDQGWMSNFRYDDSVIRQSNRRFGIVAISTVEEVFVGSRSPGAYVTSSTQMVIVVGR